MRMPLGEKLRELRVHAGLTQPEVAQQLQSLGCPAASNSISRWENGYNRPGIEQFLTLCRIYRVRNPVEAFFGDVASCPEEPLNDAGLCKLEEYRQLLIASGKYRREAVLSYPQARQLPFYEWPASAGYGVFMDSGAYEMVSPGLDVPPQATFGVAVSGDSMEPAYHHGDAVWVQQQQTLENGEIGLMLLNDRAYVKRFEQHKSGTLLISLNPAYPPMQVKEGDSFAVLGRIVARTSPVVPGALT